MATFTGAQHITSASHLLTFPCCTRNGRALTIPRSSSFSSSILHSESASLKPSLAANEFDGEMQQSAVVFSPILGMSNPSGAVPATHVRKKKIPPPDDEPHSRLNRPPDLPSILLHKRIIYIGMPLVSAVSELIISQLMFLDRDAPKKPISLYINSTGTTRDDGEIVALDQDGFAIYDALMRMRCPIKTVAFGYAMGHACLLLAAGTKGKRFMFPNSTATIQEPKVLPSGLLPTSDVLVRAQEARVSRDTFVELFAKHTGQPEEVVAQKMKKPFTMDALEAKEFGVVDKILWPGDRELITELFPRGKGIKKRKPRKGVFQNWFSHLYSSV